MNAGIFNLEKAYSFDEPDIDNLVVKESNPEYNPWSQAASGKILFFSKDVERLLVVTMSER